MTRIAVSAEFVRPSRVGGIEQALQYLVRGLVPYCGDEELAVFGNDLDPDDWAGATIWTPRRLHRIRFVQETRTFRAEADRFDAFYFPNYFTPIGPARCRVVTTIPDLQYRHFPQYFTARKRRWLAFAHGRTLKHASAVTVYSSFVRDDICDRYGVAAAERITVLPIPVDFDSLTTPCVEGAPGRPYILSVASHYKHKNLSTLIRAVRIVRDNGLDIDLVLVGQLGRNLVGVAEYEDVQRLVADLRLEDHVRVTGFVDSTQLARIYAGASLFVFPSVFEGFGLPPVEALGLGLPVITTRCASLAEVTRGLADLVDDPFDSDELADLVVRRIEDGVRPSPADVEQIRSYYSPSRIGAQFYELLAGS